MAVLNYIWACLIGLAFVAGSARAAIEITDETSDIRLMPNAQVFVDAKGAFTWTNADNIPFVDTADVAATKIAGYSRDVFWIKFHVKNQATSERALVMVHTVLDDVQLRCVDDAGRVLMFRQSGDGFPFGGRDYNIPHIAFSLPKAASYECVQRVYTTSIVDLDSHIMAPDRLASFVGDFVAQRVSLGAAILAIAVFAVTAGTWRSRYMASLMTAYAVSAISIVSWWAINSGLGMQYLWPNAVFWQNVGNGASASMSFAASAVYVATIIGKSSRIVWVPVVAAVYWFGMFLASFAVLHYPAISGLYGPSGVLHALIMLFVMGFALWRRPSARTLILAVGQMAYAIPTLTVAAWMVGAIYPAPWIKGALPTGYLAEMIFLALSLSHESGLAIRKVRTLQEQRLQDMADEKARQEQAVDERTGEISNIVDSAIHDIVGPLQSLQVRMHQLSGLVMPSAQSDYDSMYRAVTGIICTAQNLHAFERYRNGGIAGIDRAIIAPVAATQLMRQIVDEHRSAMRDRIVTVHGDMSLLAHCCDEEIKRLANNLIINFWRHTPARSRLTVMVEAVDSNVVVSFHDDGNGISEQVFEQCKAGLAKGGKTRGLYNVMRYAERSGGAVDYRRSELLGGSCIAVTLPAFKGWKT